MKKKVPPEVRFHDRLLTLRKERGLTQQALAEMAEMHISQIRRYEGGQSHPTRNTVKAAERRFSPDDSGGAPR